MLSGQVEALSEILLRANLAEFILHGNAGGRHGRFLKNLWKKKRAFRPLIGNSE